MHIHIHSYSSDDRMDHIDADTRERSPILVGLGSGLAFWLGLIGLTLWVSMTSLWANDVPASANDPMVMKVYPDGTKVILRWSEVGKNLDNGLNHGGAPKIVAYDPSKDGVVPIGEQTRSNTSAANSSSMANSGSSNTPMVSPSKDASPFMPKDGSWYVGLQNGAAFVSDVNLPGVGSLTLNTGYRLDVPLGYRVNEWFSCEFAPGFIYNTVNSVKLNELDPIFDANINLGGSLIQVPLMINALVTVPTDCPLEPYFGGGVGAMYSNVKLDLGNLAFLDPIYEGETANAHSWAFAYSGLAGLNYHIDQDISIGICYKFTGTGSQSWRPSSSDLGFGNTHVLTQSIEATATMRF